MGNVSILDKTMIQQSYQFCLLGSKFYFFSEEIKLFTPVIFLGDEAIFQVGCPHIISCNREKILSFPSTSLSLSIHLKLDPFLFAASELVSFCFRVITRTTKFGTSSPIDCYSKPMTHRHMPTNIHVE